MGRVALARGEVTVQRQGAASREPLMAGSLVEVSDTVRTGRDGLARLVLDDQSIVTLGADSEVDLQALRDGAGKRPTTLKLTLGRLWSSVLAAVSGERVFEVEGPNAVAGVRGTAFAFEVQDGTSRITVARGTVTVADASGDQRDITRGQRSVVSLGGQRVEEGVSADDLSALERSFAVRGVLDPNKARWRLGLIQGSGPSDVRVGPTRASAPGSLAAPLELEPKATTTMVSGRIEVR
jgi:hypothetical protein